MKVEKEVKSMNNQINIPKELIIFCCIFLSVILHFHNEKLKKEYNFYIEDKTDKKEKIHVKGSPRYYGKCNSSCKQIFRNHGLEYGK